MTYYRLKTAFKDDLGLIPSVFLNMDVEDIFILKEQMSHSSFYTAADLIPFMLDEEEGYLSRLTDINKWRKSKPEAHTLVISPAFKQLLEGFALPSCRFYAARCFIASEKKHYPLFVFHFHFNYIQEIILQETTFEERHQLAKPNLNRVLEKGQIKSVEEFDYYANEKSISLHWFYPDKLRFKPGVYYDVFATEDGIIVSERVKQAIEQADLTGLELSEYTDYEIIIGQKPV